MPASSEGRRRYSGPLFGNVPRAMWERADLGRDAKVLLAFLCSCPGGGGLSGIFRLHRDDVRIALGFGLKRTEALLDELHRAGLVVAEGKWCWVVEATAMTPGFTLANANHRRAVETALAEAPPTIAEGFRRRYLTDAPEPPSDEHPDEHPDERRDEHRDEHPDERRDEHRDEHPDPGDGDGTGDERRRTKDGDGTGGTASVHTEDDANANVHVNGATKETDPAERIFRTWKTSFGKDGEALTQQRRRAIEKGLTRLTEETLVLAVEGAAMLPEETRARNGKRRDDLADILRFPDRIERCATWARKRREDQEALARRDLVRSMPEPMSDQQRDARLAELRRQKEAILREESSS